MIRWPEGRSVMTGRSSCDSCGRRLAPLELVPVVSIIWLRGRCRGCGARIDRTHLAIELMAGAAGCVAGLLLPGETGAVSAVFGWLLITLAAIDARAFWLPDRLTLIVAIVGIGVGAAGIGPPLDDRAIGGVLGLAGLWAINAVYRAVRGRDGLGGGDGKLLGAIGLWVGWRMQPTVLLIASLVGLGVVLFWQLAGRKVQGDDRLPFGTLLAVAAYPAWLAMLWAA
ncbi:MAG: prepilin peptidase [Sphingomonas sp.]